MTFKYILYFFVVILISAVKADTIQFHPSELAIFNKQLTKRDVHLTKETIPIISLRGERYKRDVSPAQEDQMNLPAVLPSLEDEVNSPDILPSQEDEINSRTNIIASPLFFFDSILNLVKKMLFAATDPIVAAARDFVLGFFDVTIRGLVTFTTKSEPPALISSIIAHTLNSVLKRAVEFLVYIRETVRYFFNIFISSTNKRAVRALSDPVSSNPILRNVLVTVLNYVIANINAITGGKLYPQLVILQEHATAWIDNIFGYSQIREVRSIENRSSNNVVLKNLLTSLLYATVENFNTLTGGIFYPQLAMLQGLLANLINQIFPTV